jgi:hypothetical protein
MTETTDAGEAGNEVAYYYPEPYWRGGEVDSLKTLLLFFDQIAILLPRYMRGRETAADPVLAGPLHEQGLLRVLEPEVFVDKQMTEELSEVMVELITSGTFDDLETTGYYAALSRSRMGWDADVELAGMVIEELEVRKLARPSQDGVSVPLHPVVRTTVLVLLSQFARGAGQRRGLNLHPTTNRRAPVAALVQTLARAPLPSAGHIVALDLQTVTVDLATVPLDEVVQFRKEHGRSYREYARDLRHLLVELGPLPEQDRERLLLDRQEKLADQAADLWSTARRAWRQPYRQPQLASLSLGAAGAVWEAVGHHDLITALLALAGGIVGALASSGRTAGAYSYLFEAQQGLGSRSSVSSSS